MKPFTLLLLPALTIAAFAAAPANDWAPNATATVAWNSNLSNGEAVWDRIGAIDLGADVLASSEYKLSPTDAWHASVHLATDWVPRFYRLTRAAGGLRADWQHTFGRDAFAPVFTIEAGGDGVAVVEHERQGYTGFVNLKLAKKFGEFWRVAITDRFDAANARLAVFDSRSHEAGIEISRDINDSTRFTLSGRWRNGDVVTYAQYDRPDLRAIAHDFAPLRTFREAMTAYAANARTVGGRAALVHATAEDTALILAYDYAATKGTNLRFENQVISLSWVRQY